MDTDKQALRNEYLNKRSSLSKSVRTDKSRKIIEGIKRETSFQEAEIVLSYVNYRCEVETTELLEELLRKNEKRVFVPKVEGMNIHFYEIKDLNELSEGYQRIHEPGTDNTRKFHTGLAQNNRCIVIVPGAVFDKQMGRMGYGKGFYDRFFSDYPDLYRVAPAFACQLAKKVPTEQHDIKMNMIVTEAAVYYDRINNL